MKLKSMKIDPAMREKKYAETSAAIEAPQYPYGLCLHLDDDVLERLGLKDLPDVDTKLDLVARVTVTSVSSNQTTGGGDKRRSLSLQITELGLEDPAAKAEDVLYES